jgi:hypothetical protein
MEVTSQFLATAALQILLPKKPFPPQTTIFRLADADAAVEAIGADVVFFNARGSVCGVNQTRRMSEYVCCSVVGVCWSCGMIVQMRNGSVQCLVSMFRSTGGGRSPTPKDVIDIGIEIATGATCG